MGDRGLARAKRDVPALAEVELRLPDITFQKELHVHLGHRHLELYHTPGHTPDGIGAMVLEDKVFVAGDAVMPVPYVVNGDYRELKQTLELIKEFKPNFMIQGHGDVLLRGEIDEALDTSIAYLDNIVKRVARIVERREPMQKLREIDIESAGKSRIPLDGLVSKLHTDNLVAIYRALNRKANEQAKLIGGRLRLFRDPAPAAQFLANEFQLSWHGRRGRDRAAVQVFENQTRMKRAKCGSLAQLVPDLLHFAVHNTQQVGDHQPAFQVVAQRTLAGLVIGQEGINGIHDFLNEANIRILVQHFLASANQGVVALRSCPTRIPASTAKSSV